MLEDFDFFHHPLQYYEVVPGSPLESLLKTRQANMEEYFARTTHQYKMLGFDRVSYNSDGSIAGGVFDDPRRAPATPWLYAKKREKPEANPQYAHLRGVVVWHVDGRKNAARYLRQNFEVADKLYTSEKDLTNLVLSMFPFETREVAAPYFPIKVGYLRDNLVIVSNQRLVNPDLARMVHPHELKAGLEESKNV